MTTRLRWISSVTLVLTLMAGLLALASGPQSVSAQRDRATRTPRSGDAGQGGALQATLTAVAGSASGAFGTAQAALTNLPNTADGLLATAQAAMTQVSGGAAGMLATAQAYLTALPPLSADVMATAQAYLTAIPGQLNMDSLQAWLATLYEVGGVSYNPQTGVLTLSAEISEANLNTAITQALLAAGYSASGVVVDLVSGGMTVTVQSITLNAEMSGSLNMTLTVGAVDGRLELHVTSASLNGRALPAGTVAELDAALNSALDGYVITFPFPYYVQAVTVTDTAIISVVDIILPTA